MVLQDSNGFKAGERVLTWASLVAGGYASQLLAANNLARIPDNVSFEEAAAAGLAASNSLCGGLFDPATSRRANVSIRAGSSGVGSIGIQLSQSKWEHG